MIIGQNIKDLCENNGISVKQLAKKIGILRLFVHRCERLSRCDFGNGSFIKVKKIVYAMQISVNSANETN